MLKPFKDGVFFERRRVSLPKRWWAWGAPLEPRTETVWSLLMDSQPVNQNEILDVRMNSYKYVKHFCRYVVMKRTIEVAENSKKWLERCKCGRMKWCDCTFFTATSKIPKITITWFDREGNQCRIPEKEISPDHFGTNPAEVAEWNIIKLITCFLSCSFQHCLLYHWA